MIVIPAQELRERITALFQAADAPEAAARRVAESLVENNLLGHDSHGVMMAVPYVRRIQDGLQRIIIHRSITVFPYAPPLFYRFH